MNPFVFLSRHLFSKIFSHFSLVFGCVFTATVSADIVNVYNGNSLHAALRNAKAGDEIVLQPGFYQGIKSESPAGKRHYFYSHQSGKANQPIVSDLDSYLPQAFTYTGFTDDNYVPTSPESSNPNRCFQYQGRAKTEFNIAK